MSENKLILGTVQFGMHYGINNKNGIPTGEESFAIMSKANELGIRYLDTAAAYGDSEKIIGNYKRVIGNNDHFKIITKISGNKSFTAQVKESLEKLNCSNIDILLFHSYKSFFETPNVLEEVKSLREKGVIERLGVSVYNNFEIDELLKIDDIEVIQLPFNLFDNENLRGDILRKAKNYNKIIHTRSVFLQGLFFKPINELPEHLSPLKSQLIKIHKIAEVAGLTIKHLALGYALSKDYIDGVLMGVYTENQLIENMNSTDEKLPISIIKEIDSITVKEKHLLNPSNWNR